MYYSIRKPQHFFLFMEMWILSTAQNIQVDFFQFQKIKINIVAILSRCKNNWAFSNIHQQVYIFVVVFLSILIKEILSSDLFFFVNKTQQSI
jgi:hypothetical protein